MIIKKKKKKKKKLCKVFNKIALKFRLYKPSLGRWGDNGFALSVCPYVRPPVLFSASYLVGNLSEADITFRACDGVI